LCLFLSTARNQAGKPFAFGEDDRDFEKTPSLVRFKFHITHPKIQERLEKIIPHDPKTVTSRNPENIERLTSERPAPVSELAMIKGLLHDSSHGAKRSSLLM